MRRRTLLLAVPALAAAALFACSSDSSSSPSLARGDDGGTFEGPDGGAGKDATPVDAGPPVVTVVVTARTVAKAGITVVWHDASGAVIGTTKTGADGRTSSAGMATPSMVSALLGSSTGTTEVVTWTGVALGDQLLAQDLDDPSTVVGHFDVKMPGDPDNGATTYAAVSGRCASSTTNDPTGNVDIPLVGPCVRNSNSILLRATDDQGTVLSYSFLNGNVAPQNGSTLPVVAFPAFLDPVDVAITAQNTNNANVTTQLVEVADELPFANGAGAVDNDTTTFKVANGFADTYELGLLGAPNDAPAGALLFVGRRVAPGAAFSVDFAQALPVLSTVTSDVTAPARPKLAWTSVASLATSDGGAVSLTWTAGGKKHGWTLVVPPSAAAGTVTAPALPADATAWAFPAADGAVDGVEALFAESDVMAGYAEFRAAAALAIPSVHDATRLADAVLPLNGSLRATQLRPPPN